VGFFFFKLLQTFYRLRYWVSPHAAHSSNQHAFNVAIPIALTHRAVHIKAGQVCHQGGNLVLSGLPLYLYFRPMMNLFAPAVKA